MTSHEPENPHSTEPDNPDTEVITIAAPAPVFVDSTGRRSRRLRRLAYAFGALVMTYGGLIGVSLAGGPVRSSAVLPLPGLEPETEGDRVSPRPGPTPAPAPAPSLSLSPSQAAATARYITEAMPRRTVVSRPPVQRIESDKVPPKPPAPKPSPSATPKPSGSTKPTESTTTKPATKPTTKPVVVPPTPSTPVTTKPPVTVPPVVGPVPPAPSGPAGGSGGQGGGSVLGPGDDEPSPAAPEPVAPEPAAPEPAASKPAAVASEEEMGSKPGAAVLINATPSVELADLTEQVEADPEPTVAEDDA